MEAGKVGRRGRLLIIMVTFSQAVFYKEKGEETTLSSWNTSGAIKKWKSKGHPQQRAWGRAWAGASDSCPGRGSSPGEKTSPPAVTPSLPQLTASQGCLGKT